MVKNSNLWKVRSIECRSFPTGPIKLLKYFCFAGHPSDTLTVELPPGRPHQPVIKRSYLAKGGSLVIDFSYPCPTTGETTFRATWACAAEKTEGLSCPSQANVTQKFITPKTIQLMGLPGGHYFDVKVVAMVDGCHGGDCEVASNSHVAFITCGYRCKDKTCLHNLRAK